VTLVAGLAPASSAAAAPHTPKLAAGVAKSAHSLTSVGSRAAGAPRALSGKSASALPAGVPSTGNYAFLLKLSTRTTGSAFSGARLRGVTAAKSAAKAELRAVTSAQDKVIAKLPAKSKVLYRTHAVLSGVAVTTDVRNYQALKALKGVTAVYPIAPKTASNSYAVPLQGAPTAWKAFGDLGANSSVAIIDTGVDYTHADFGGVGTVADYTAAKAQLGKPVSAGEFPGAKVIGGFDFAGDAYDAAPTDPTYNPVPAPDPYPLDCNSHGSHVAGTVAGYGENADGSTYTGAYNNSTPFSTLRIGPGMAPLAKLYAYRVFGCAGSTDLVSQAIDRAADPNGDGDTSDHVDVVNMSLGSDYGSPQDGDSVITNAAAALGISMVVASGNGGDLYDVGGSPGDAPRTIAVAASADAYSQVDALNVSAPATIAGSYAAERSIAYDYVTKPDLSGDVVQLTQPGNADGCLPITDPYKSQIAGHIAFVEWTDDSTVRRCGSAARAANIVAAGATGFIYADDEESFAAGITGSATIPGVLAAKSAGDAIRAQLVAHNTVTISGTTANGFAQLDPSLNDTVAGFSSRGIADAGNVKPDVTAVGVSVFSAGNGTGNQGLNDSGTSMATPMVAGTAALVHSLHPDWNAEQVKADIMNTADVALYTGTDHTGDKFAPNRVGSGRIDVNQALANKSLAYSIDNATDGTDNGTVSVSFGQLEITPSASPTVLTKTIKVQNTSLSAASYATSFITKTSIPGVSYSVSPSSLTVDARSSKTVKLTLTINPSKLTKTIDPTVDRLQGGLPREYQADASGIVFFKGVGVPNLRVPAYAAPRPASVMTQPASLTLPSGAVQTALLPLSGAQVNQGSGAEAVKSIVSGFELQATSGLAPSCSVTVTSACVSFPDERAADLKYIGATSNAPQLASIGGNILTSPNGLAYFSITTQGSWRTAASSQEFDIYIDSNGDGAADSVLFNSRLTGSDTMVDELIDLTTGAVLDAEPINDRFGDTDTALLNSDTLVMPVAVGALPGISAATSRIKYTVLAFDPYHSGPVDQVGDILSSGDIVNPLSLDVAKPGVAVYGSYDGNASALLFRDSPGSVLALRRDAAAYAADHGKGALVVHFQNKVGNKAQIVSLKSAPAVSLTMTPGTVVHGKPVTVTITVTGSGGVTPTGRVLLNRPSSDGSQLFPVKSGTLANGKATFSYRQAVPGNYSYVASYDGDANYVAAQSSTVKLKVIS
jgi:subtilisin family serine protease